MNTLQFTAAHTSFSFHPIFEVLNCNTLQCEQLN
jgi:hypothetical protein